MVETPAAANIALAKHAMAYLNLPRAERAPNYQDAYFDALADDVEFSLAVPPDTYIWGEALRGREAVKALFDETPWSELMEARGVQSEPEFFASEDGSRVVMIAQEGWKILKTGVEVNHRE